MIEVSEIALFLLKKLLSAKVWDFQVYLFNQNQTWKIVCTEKSFPLASTAQQMKFFIKDFFSKCHQIRRKLQIWSHLLKKIRNGKLHFLYSVYICI